ncbi:starch-binding protein [uncultured Clostridium sp.]|uniref:starch-binding protein n=1 Tax=uncultured Clostridium sp. TaxID=59620 RepID=UPI0025E51E37|nr:starch-binding protein [uncultured Clostridium sp.]
MGKMSKRLTSLITTLVLTTGLICVTGLFKAPVKVYAADTEATTNYGLASKTRDGVILHAWNWSFNTIKENLPKIAKAGYTSIQTSPIQGTKENTMTTAHWWLLYHPTNFKIGNAQLGSKDEFKSMCEEAEKYGIKIIVDVVCNHMANTSENQNKFSQDIEDKYKTREFWHEYDNPHGIDYNNRYSITHDCMDLPDLNTSNKTLQNDIISFLNDAIDCGADGFRFDAAKHIELPDDPDGSDFWPTILENVKNKDKLFIYGEILDTNNGNSRTSAYSNYINVNSDSYSKELRKGIGFDDKRDVAKNIGQASSSYYNTDNVDSKKLVTYVETHDDYAANGSGASSNTGLMSDWYNKMGWAIVAARDSGTPLYYNRPAGSSSSNPLPGTMGNAGNDMWKSTDVVAVNKFHNAMIGEKEYIRTLSNNTMVIERGNKGAVIVNLDGTAKINTETNLEDGTYKSIASDGGTFYVSGGRLTGTVASGQIAVFYKEDAPQVSISKESCDFTNTLDLTLGASNYDKAYYTINGAEEVEYSNGKIITIGKDSAVGSNITVTLKGVYGEKEVEKTYRYTKVEPSKQKVVYFKKPSRWGTPKVYIYDDTTYSTVKKIAAWPGVEMTSNGGNLYSYTLPEEWNDLDAKVIFTDGTNQTSGTNKAGLELTSRSMLYDNGSWTEYVEPEITPEVSSSKEDCSFKGTLELTLGCKNVDKATYSINGAEEVEYSNGKIITIGKDSAVGSNITVTLKGVYGEKEVEKTYRYTKVEPSKQKVVYFKKPSRWGTPKVYIYDDTTYSTVKKIAAWPGVEMTSNGGNLYSYTLPEEWNDLDAKVIFTDGTNQTSGTNKAGLELTSRSMLYDNGSWTEYNEDNTDEALVAYFVKPSNWETPRIYVYDDSTGTVKKISSWPGELMTSEGENLYSYTLPKEWRYAKVIFTDGTNQTPSANGSGFEMKTNMIYDNGSWTEYK